MVTFFIPLTISKSVVGVSFKVDYTVILLHYQILNLSNIAISILVCSLLFLENLAKSKSKIIASSRS